MPDEWLAEADIPPGEQLKPHYRPALVKLVHRLCEMEKLYEASARAGAARLAFRQRWAVLSAAGIYGEIARAVDRAGGHAWDHRVVTSRLRKEGFVAAGLVRAAMPANEAPHPAWSRRRLAALADGQAPSQSFTAAR